MKTTKTFKSGNSVAVRLPKSLGIEAGTEMRVREESGRYVLEPVDQAEADRSDRYLRFLSRPEGGQAASDGTARAGLGELLNVAEPRFLLDANILVYLVGGSSEPLRRRVPKNVFGVSSSVDCSASLSPPLDGPAILGRRKACIAFWASSARSLSI